MIRDKHALVSATHRRNAEDPSYRYQQNELYDSLVSQLIHDRLHRDRSYTIAFARRGARDRTHAFAAAVMAARKAYERRWGIEGSAPVSICTATPTGAPCLQATDYLLWALQRLVERGDERYLAYVWPCVRLVRDLDDVRSKPYGEYYTREKPLTGEALAGRSRRI